METVHTFKLSIIVALGPEEGCWAENFGFFSKERREANNSGNALRDQVRT